MPRVKKAMVELEMLTTPSVADEPLQATKERTEATISTENNFFIFLLCYIICYKIGGKIKRY